jgi:hypothetical protein
VRHKTNLFVSHRFFPHSKMLGERRAENLSLSRELIMMIMGIMKGLVNGHFCKQAERTGRKMKKFHKKCSTSEKIDLHVRVCVWLCAYLCGIFLHLISSFHRLMKGLIFHSRCCCWFRSFIDVMEIIHYCACLRRK